MWNLSELPDNLCMDTASRTWNGVRVDVAGGSVALQLRHAFASSSRSSSPRGPGSTRKTGRIVAIALQPGVQGVDGGAAPHHWQLQARIERSKALLLDTNGWLEDIVSATDLADAVHFGRTFRKLTNATPAAWRTDRLT